MSVLLAKAIKNPSGAINLPVQPVSGIGALCGAAALIAGVVVTALLRHPAPAIIGILIGLYLLFSLKVADQWEKVARAAAGPLSRVARTGIVPHYSGDRHDE